MPVFGKVIVIRRNGADGSKLPITTDTCVFGRGSDCDIRVQLPYVSDEQCKLIMNKNGEFELQNISKSNDTIVNNKVVRNSVKLFNKDIITVVDRSFRFEYPENSAYYSNKQEELSKKSPLGEQAAQENAQVDSPFGRLVNDMKTMIKSGTPKRKSKNFKEKSQVGRRNSTDGKPAVKSPKPTPKAARSPGLSGSKKENLSAAKKESGPPVLLSPRLRSKNDVKEEECLSVDMLSADILRNSNSATTADAEEKENMEEQKRRRSSDRLSNVRNTPRKSINKASFLDQSGSDGTLAQPSTTTGIGAEDEVATASTKSTPASRIKSPSNKAMVPKPDSSKKRSSSRSSFSNDDQTLNPKAGGRSNKKTTAVREVETEVTTVSTKSELVSGIKSPSNKAIAPQSNSSKKRRSSSKSSFSDVSRTQRVEVSQKPSSSEAGGESNKKVNAVSVREEVETEITTATTKSALVSGIKSPSTNAMASQSNSSKKRRSSSKSSFSDVSQTQEVEVSQKPSSPKAGGRSKKKTTAVPVREKVEIEITTATTKSALVSGIKSPSNKAIAPQSNSSKKRRSSSKSSFSDVSQTQEVEVSQKPSSPKAGGKSKKKTTAVPVKESASESLISAQGSLNSSQSDDFLNDGMITETSITPSSSFETNSQNEQLHTKSSRRSSLNRKAASTPKSNSFTENDKFKHSLDSSASVPNISLTPTNSAMTTPEDPYNFPEEASVEKTKKYRRRSSGTAGLSRKQTLLLFGSPRIKELTPLRRSIGRLRKNSEPLMEIEAEVASPELSKVSKKSREPLPEVVEVENNSSPIKKPPVALKSGRLSSGVNTPSPAANQRRKSQRVSFGPDLSPEQFLKELPPNTPVRKGATPTRSSTRKSLAAVGITPLPTVTEVTEGTFKSPIRRYQKVNRTPTPFKPDSSKKKSKSLLDQVLRASLANEKSEISTSSSPKLTRKRKSTDVEASPKAKQPEKKTKSPKISQKRRSLRNTPIVNVHKTVTNLRRRSVGSPGKPLWSEIVKRAAKKPVAAAKKTTDKTRINTKNKKEAKKKGYQTSASNHHVDSPATMYISRTKSRIQPTRTPRPPKQMALAKLDIPDEDYTGVPEMFKTPVAADINETLDLITPKSVGEMLVSPMSGVCETEKDESLSAIGASPDFKSAKSSAKDGPSAAKRRRLSASSSLGRLGLKRLSKSPKQKTSEIDVGVKKKLVAEKEKSKPIEEHFGVKRLLQTPKEKQSVGVDDHFGTKRLLKTPREAKGQPVEEHFGTKRLLKTPREAKGQPVEEHFGTKRLLKTPREAKGQPVEEHFGTKRLLKTPREAKGQPVEEHFGTKRLLKTPREAKGQPVEEHFGTKRLLKTPREAKSQPVEEHFGTKRLLRTPRDPKSNPVEDCFGFERLMKSPKEKISNTVEEHFGTKRMFKTPRGQKSASVESNFGLQRMFESRETRSKAKTTGIPENEELHLSLLFSTEENETFSEKAEKLDDTAAKAPIASENKCAVTSVKSQSSDVMLTEGSETSMQTRPGRQTRNAKVVAKKSEEVAKKDGKVDTLAHQADEVVRDFAVPDITKEVPVIKKTATRSKKTVKANTSKKVAKTESNEACVEQEEAVEEVSGKSKKHVTFHSSVKPVIVESDLLEEEPAKPAGRRGRKMQPATDLAVAKVATTTRRGKSKRVAEGNIAAENTPANLKASKKRKVDEVEKTVEASPNGIASSKSSLKARRGRSKVVDEKPKEAETQNTKNAVFTAPTKRKTASKKDKNTEIPIIVGSSDDIEVVKEVKSATRRGRSAKSKVEETIAEPTKTSTRKGRSRLASKEDEAKNDAKAPASPANDKKSAKAARRTRGKTPDSGSATEEIPMKVSSGDDVEFVEEVKSASRRGRSTKSKSEEAVAEPTKTSTRKGRSRLASKEDEAKTEIPMKVSSGDGVEFVEEVKSASRRGRSTKSKSEEAVTEPTKTSARKGRSRLASKEDEAKTVATPTRRGRSKRVAKGNIAAEDTPGSFKASKKRKVDIVEKTVEEVAAQPTKTSTRKGRSRLASKKDEAKNDVETTASPETDAKSTKTAKKTTRKSPASSSVIADEPIVKNTAKPVSRTRGKSKVEKVTEIPVNVAFGNNVEVVEEVKRATRKGRSTKTKFEEHTVVAATSTTRTTKRGKSASAITEEKLQAPASNSKTTKPVTKVRRNAKKSDEEKLSSTETADSVESEMFTIGRRGRRNALTTNRELLKGKEIVAQVEKEAPKRSRRVGSKDSQDKTGVKEPKQTMRKRKGHDVNNDATSAKKSKKGIAAEEPVKSVARGRKVNAAKQEEPVVRRSSRRK